MTFHIGWKSSRIRFDKIDEFTKVYGRTRYLVLLSPEKYDAVYNRIRYFISLKDDIAYIFLSLFCKNQRLFLWFFTYRKNFDFA